MEPWTGAQHAFSAKAFYKNGDSFVIVQCEFQKEFGIHHNHLVSSAHVINTWVQNFDATGSALKKKGGSVKTVCTSENIVVVREAIKEVHTILCVATVRHSGCLKPVFNGFYTKILTSTPTMFKLLMHYMNVTM
jgi:transposase